MGDVANPERGEIEVDLEGVPHVLTPSFEAQVAIERQTGNSIEQLADQAGRSALPLDHAAIIVAECVKAHGLATNNTAMTRYSTDRVARCIVNTGKLQVVKRLELLLFLAATGGYDASGNPKPLTTKAGTPGADTDA